MDFGNILGIFFAEEGAVICTRQETRSANFPEKSKDDGGGGEYLNKRFRGKGIKI